MNYEEMSDFQINKRVASKFGLAPLTYPHDADMRSVGVRHSDTWYEWFDYCNNPSDAMPILIKMKIGFKWVNGSCTASSVMRGYHESTSNNPLRAAMIVFLMMQEQAK